MKIEKRRPAFEYSLVNNTKDLFSTIFDATPVAMVLLSWPVEKVLKVNKAALSLLKVKSLDVFVEQYFGILEHSLEDNLKGKDFFQSEIKLKKSTGTYAYLIIKARIFEKNKVILTLEDITLHKNKEKKLLLLAQKDGLTGLLNHKTILQRFNEELSRAKRYRLPLSCLIIDVDDFKNINDKLGHLKGDLFLKKTAEMLKSNMRETDIVGRYGGDEFLIILPETPVNEALVPARRLHAYIEKNPLSMRHGKLTSDCTYSIGISGFPLKGLETVKDIIHHADKGLYDSKVKGGNHIVLLKA